MHKKAQTSRNTFPLISGKHVKPRILGLIFAGTFIFPRISSFACKLDFRRNFPFPAEFKILKTRLYPTALASCLQQLQQGQLCPPL